jgi:hypothetical protein
VQASASFFEPFLRGPIQTLQLGCSVIGRREAKNGLFLRAAVLHASLAKAPQNRKFFAELFYKKATAYFA